MSQQVQRIRLLAPATQVASGGLTRDRPRPGSVGVSAFASWTEGGMGRHKTTADLVISG